MSSFDENEAERDSSEAHAPMARSSGLTRTVALVGLMGAGKTSIGRRLANHIGARFRDADVEIEEAAGMSIPEIFDAYGEPSFRAGERRVIQRLLNDPPHVLATGGGAFIDDEIRAAIASKAISVWLRADLETLVARVGRRDTRPLLRQGEPREILSRLIEVRHPIYAEADIVVDSRDAPHEEALRALVQALEAAGAIAGDASARAQAPMDDV